MDHLQSPSRAVAARRAARATWQGIIEVLVGTDAPVPTRSRAERAWQMALTVLGAVLILVAILDTVLTLHAFSGPFRLQISNQFTAPVKPNGPFGNGVVVHRVGVQVTSSAWIRFIPIFVGVGSVLLAIRHPLVGWRIGYLAALFFSLVAFFPLWLLHSSWMAAQLAMLVVVYCIAGWRHSRAALWWMWALMLFPAWLWQGPGFLRPAYLALALAAMTVAIDALGASRRAAQELAAQSERTELEEARRAVLEERTRIARELHDVVAHHLSLIAVQTETAPFRLTDLPTSALRELSSVSDQAREALTDMRRLLGVLRNGAAAERTPQPRLSDVPELVNANRRAGVAVELSMAADDERVPPSVGLCAYRIVQEALSNVNRHARGSSVTVSIARDEQGLYLQVRNGPGTSPPPPVPHKPGQGISGMRERVAILGGSLSAQPSHDGGFTVVAVLPFEAAPVSPS